MCLSECDLGTYGDMCNEKCGNCKDQSECHYSNGTCLTGCNDGFQGALCKTRKILTVYFKFQYIKDESISMYYLISYQFDKIRRFCFFIISKAYICVYISHEYYQKRKQSSCNNTDTLVLTYEWS